MPLPSRTAQSLASQTMPRRSAEIYTLVRQRNAHLGR